MDGRSIRIPGNHLHYAKHDLVDPAKFEKFWGCVENDNGLVDCSKPKLHRYLNGDDFELSSLPEEECDYERFHEILPHELVFDLGAYCGVTSIRFARKCREVVSIEPDPLNWQFLRRNILRHKAKNIVPLRCAVTPEAGIYEFLAEGALGSGLSSSLGKERIRNSTIDVLGIPLHTLVEMYGEPDFIKVDIELAEVEVLRASLPKIPRTNFAVDAMHGVTNQVREIFLANGYQTEETPEILWAW